MGCYRTILVALDGSPDAEAALRHGATLARDQHARLILLTVVPPSPPQMVTPGGVTPSRSEHEAAFREILRNGVDLLPPDVGVESRIVHGRPAPRILETAEACHCDLIVMGFHGHGRLHRALAGSVSGDVLRQSRLPVLLMRGPEPGLSSAAQSSESAAESHTAGSWPDRSGSRRSS
jgi:nucleotide-binding universal stress UspA family protein